MLRRLVFEVTSWPFRGIILVPFVECDLFVATIQSALGFLSPEMIDDGVTIPSLPRQFKTRTLDDKRRAETVQTIPDSLWTAMP